jgi:enterochelin esterase family protein
MAGLVLAACGSSPDGVRPTTDGGAPTDAQFTPDASAPDTSAAPDSGSKPDCSRKAQAQTANLTLWDTFQADLANLSGAARQARADKLVADLAAAGGAPFEDPKSDRVVFIVKGAGPVGPWSVAGGFTGWKANARPMIAVAGTDLSALDTTVQHGTAQAYKLLSGTSDTGFREDPLAKNVWWDGIDHKDVGEFNAMVHAVDGDAAKGRLVRWSKVTSQKLPEGPRDVFVYLPARYDDGSCTALPVAIFHDGNESLTRSDFAGAADALFGQKPELSAVLVFVALPSQSLRIDEYTFATQTAKAPAYVSMLADEILPRVRSELHVCSTQTATGVSGASLGGLVSSFAAFERPDVFGWVGSQSGSYWWDNASLVARVDSQKKEAVRFYVDHGCPNDNCDSNRAMNDALVKKGYDVVHVEEPNAQHDWAYWRGRFPGMLQTFRQGRVGCQ